MLLTNGNEVDAVSKIKIDNTEYIVSKLPNAFLIHGVLTRYVLICQQNFQEFVDQVKKESDELTNIPPDVDITPETDIITESVKTSEGDNNVMDGAKVSKDDISETGGIQTD